MKIQVIEPVVNFRERALEEYPHIARPDTELITVSLDKGPASIESSYDAALAVPDVVKKIIAAERNEVDAVISNCMDDPGVEAAREMVSIPVIGPAEISMHFAAILGQRFTIIATDDSASRGFYSHAERAHLKGKLASVRAINIPVLELGDDKFRLVTAIVEQSVKAVRDDGAHVILFGCTSMVGLANEVKEGLIKHGITDVPVIDPAFMAVKIAELLVDMGLSHSKRTYPFPPDKEIIGY